MQKLTRVNINRAAHDFVQDDIKEPSMHCARIPINPLPQIQQSHELQEWFLGCLTTIYALLCGFYLADHYNARPDCVMGVESLVDEREFPGLYRRAIRDLKFDNGGVFAEEKQLICLLLVMGQTRKTYRSFAHHGISLK